jgi:hypothetical protein
VFARLQSLNDCVILFDEIEEFCLDRESPGLVSLLKQNKSICFILTPSLSHLHAFLAQ